MRRKYSTNSTVLPKEALNSRKRHKGCLKMTPIAAERLLIESESLSYMTTSHSLYSYWRYRRVLLTMVVDAHQQSLETPKLPSNYGTGLNKLHRTPTALSLKMYYRTCHVWKLLKKFSSITVSFQQIKKSVACCLVVATKFESLWNCINGAKNDNRCIVPPRTAQSSVQERTQSGRE